MITRYYANVKDAEVFAGPEGPFVLWTDHMAEVCKLRDKLLEVAKECKDCDGAGVQTIFGESGPCPACEDLRELLA
jgi:hypothetical protein